LDRAKASEPSDPKFLFFGGADVWRYGDFLYGGLLWSPGGVDADGFTLKTVLSGGGYSYISGALNADINGTTMSAATLPGWKFSHDGLYVSVFAGPVVQDYRLTPYDPGSHLHGLYVGGEFATDLWLQPTPATMAELNGTVASIGPTGSLRAAFGVRVFDRMFVGPESKEIWCGNFEQVQLGAHVTALRINAFEWSAGSGWSITSDHRTGPYLRVGFNARY
jgi:hypothetical protein